MSHREVRVAPDTGVFNARAISRAPERNLPGGPWWRLARKGYAREFYANPGSRLTPSSYAFPCVYLGTDHKTIVSEIYGDKFAAAQRAAHRYFAISICDAASYTYRRVDSLPAGLNVCDLTDPDTLGQVGIDGSTLYTIDFQITQEWAERIARHPAHFDGIIYPSRHTFQKCIVLWRREGSARDVEREITFLDDGEFIYSKPAYEAAAARGLKLTFI